MIDFDYPEEATPLDPNEVEGLLLTHITTQAELDRWEQDNINDAIDWLDLTKPKDILNESFMLKLHKKMFGNVWKWAGQLRKSDKNIGSPWWRIPADIKTLCDDINTWIELKTYSPDEIAVRFHHRLVSIHLFANGNGRHARLMADLLLENTFGQPRFTWGGVSLVKASDCRRRYIEALQAADEFDYNPLMKFVRS